MISKKIPPDKIFPRSYMDFEQKYQKDPGMNRVKGPQKKKKRLKYNRGKRWEGREGGRRPKGQCDHVVMSNIPERGTTVPTPSSETTSEITLC